MKLFADLTIWRLKSLGFNLAFLSFAFLIFYSNIGTANTAAFQWKGEDFLKKQGGFFLYLEIADAKRKSITVLKPIEIKVYGVLQRKHYTFKQWASDFNSKLQATVWKLPAGKYVIKEIKFMDNKKQSYRWAGKKSKKLRFLIRRHGLSNLGRWNLKLAKNGQVLLKIKMMPNTFRSRRPVGEEAVSAIYHGFNGSIQKVIGNHKLSKKKKKRSPEDKNTLLYRHRSVRNISLKWTINMYRYQHHAQHVNEVISSHDPYLRKCYTDRLEEEFGLKGSVSFAFILSKKTDSIRKLKRLKSSLDSPILFKCLRENLLSMQFSLNKNILGKIKFEFNAF